MKKKLCRGLAIMATAAMMAGILTGCGSGSKQAESQTTGAATATVENGAASSETTAAVAEPQINAKEPLEGMTLKEDIVLGMGSKHSDFDSAEAGTVQHSYLFRMMQDTLVHFNNETQELEPQLATEWTIEDGGKTYIFKLRDDVKFHNGEELKASDVVFSFERMEGSAFGNSVFIKIASVEAIDDLTVKMTLKDANMDWLYTLSLPTSSILSEKAVTENEEEGPAVGTGPWKLDSYEFGNYTKLAAFDECWRGAPNAKTFTFRTLPEASARLIALQNNEIDICMEPAAIEYGIIEDDPNLDLFRYDGTSLSYIAFNTQKAPGNNLDLRKAIAYTVDVDSIISVVLEGNGRKATSVWGWNQYGYHDMGGYTRDLEKAKEHLAKAFPDGNAKLEISVMGSSHKTMAEILQAQLKEIGLELSIVELDGAGMKQALINGDHEVCSFALGMNIYGDDTRRLLQPKISSNTALYDSEYVIDLMDKAMQEPDDTKRKEYYKLVQEDLYENIPYIPLYFSRAAIALRKGVGGLDVYPTNHHDFSNVYVPVN